MQTSRTVRHYKWVLGGGIIKSASGTWVGRKQDDDSVFLGPKAFRRERVEEWWCLASCLHGIGCYPSCPWWQKLVTLPPQRGPVEEMDQVTVKWCCSGWGCCSSPSSQGSCSTSSNIWAFSCEKHRDFCMKWAVKWAAGHRWCHILPQLLNKASIKIL